MWFAYGHRGSGGTETGMKDFGLQIEGSLYSHKA